MTDPAETSLILRPLSLLSHLYEQDRRPQLPDAPAPEVCIHWRRADIKLRSIIPMISVIMQMHRPGPSRDQLTLRHYHFQGASRWSRTASQVGMMDNLLRACFAPAVDDAAVSTASDTEADTAGSAQSSHVPAEQAALRAAHAAEARMVQAHMSYSARHLARSACDVLNLHLSWKQDAQLSAQRIPIQDLEASARLEAADEHLNRLGQEGTAGSELGSLGKGEDWLDQEAQLQSSQGYSKESNDAGTSKAVLGTPPHRSRACSVAETDQQDAQLQSLLDFDEGPGDAMTGSLQPPAPQEARQRLASEESAVRPLPDFFLAADEDSAALEGLLESAQRDQGNQILHALEPELEAMQPELPADTSEGAIPAKGALPSFFQPEAGKGLLDGALDLGPLQDESLEGEGSQAQVGPEEQQAALAEAVEVALPYAAGQRGSIATVSPLLQPEEAASKHVSGQLPPSAEEGHEPQAAASQASSFGGELRPTTPAAAQEPRHMQMAGPAQPSSSTQGSAACADASQVLLQSAVSQPAAGAEQQMNDLWEAVSAMSRAASLRAELDAMAQALGQAEAAQQAKHNAIAQYEWMHEAVLGPAGVLGPPMQLTQEVCLPLMSAVELQIPLFIYTIASKRESCVGCLPAAGMSV